MAALISEPHSKTLDQALRMISPKNEPQKSSAESTSSPVFPVLRKSVCVCEHIFFPMVFKCAIIFGRGVGVG